MKKSTITAVSLAREMKLSPKRVRSVLRAHLQKGDGGWVFDASRKSELKEMIRAARKRATIVAPRPAKRARKLADTSPSDEVLWITPEELAQPTDDGST